MRKNAVTSVMQLGASLVLFLIVLFAFFTVYNRYEHVPVREANVQFEDFRVVNGKIYLKWQCNNTYLTSYNVYRSDNKQGFRHHASQSSSDRSFLDDTVKDKNHYAYMVRGYNGEADDVKSSPDSDYIYIYVDKSSKNDVFQVAYEAAETGGVLSWDYFPNQPLTDCQILKKADDEWIEISKKDAHLTSYRLLNVKEGDIYKVRLSFYLNEECVFTVDSNEVQT